MGSPGIDWIEIPTKAGPRAPHPVIWPHRFFATYREENFEGWVKVVRGVKGGPREFCESIQDSVFAKRHAELPKKKWDHTIPLGMHGDGGAFSKQESLYTLSWNALMADGKTAAKRFIFTLHNVQEV